MARLLITLLISVFVSVLYVWTLEYKSSWNGAPLSENTPRFILFEKSLKECLYACALRPWCKVVGYHRYGFCEIFFDTFSSEETQCSKEDCQEKDTSMMFVERGDLVSQDREKCDKACPKDSTGLLKTCDFTSGASKCRTDACPPFNKTDPNGKFLGNTHEIGHKRRLQCNLGYRPLDPNNVTSECQGGRWANVTTCIQVCPLLGKPNNGEMIGDDSLYENATRTLNCRQGYGPLNTTNVVSRCAKGRWTEITKCVQVCGPFENIPKGKVVGESVFEGATRTLTCDPGYRPRDYDYVVSHCKNGNWTNTTECVKDCTTSPCMNGGVCENLAGGYKCACKGEWKGRNCDVNDSHNVAVGKNSTQTDTANGRAASLGNDGDRSTCTDTTSSDASWEVDLGGECQIESVILRGMGEGQWISRVIAFSSEYSTNSWSAQKIIGLPNVYPTYGVNVEAWTPMNIDANQFLEFEFPNIVHVSKIDIYETRNAGGVKAVKCYDVTGTWITLWSTSQVSVIKNARIFSPSLTSTIPCFSNRIRLDIDCSQANWYVEIDAVRLHGYKDTDSPLKNVEVYLGPSIDKYTLAGFHAGILVEDQEVQVSGVNMARFVKVKMNPSVTPLQLCEALVLGFQQLG